MYHILIIIFLNIIHKYIKQKNPFLNDQNEFKVTKVEHLLSKVFSFLFSFDIYQTKTTKILADKYNGIMALELKKK